MKKERKRKSSVMIGSTDCEGNSWKSTKNAKRENENGREGERGFIFEESPPVVNLSDAIV